MQRNVLHKLLVFLGMTMILGNLFGCSAIAQGTKKPENGTKGSCGENMTWEYDAGRKKLTITGSGEMVTPNRFMWSD